MEKIVINTMKIVPQIEVYSPRYLVLLPPHAIIIHQAASVIDGVAAAAAKMEEEEVVVIIVIHAALVVSLLVYMPKGTEFNKIMQLSFYRASRATIL